MAACTKQESSSSAPVNTTPSTPAPVVSTPTEKVYPMSVLEGISTINKTTSWYNTNKSFTELFDVFASYYWGFELVGSNLVPYNTGTTSSWSSSKTYYWNDLGTYLYTDLTGDGKKIFGLTIGKILGPLMKLVYIYFLNTRKINIM